MKTIVKVLLLFSSLIMTAQHFEQDLPDDFTSIGIQIDPFGSIDKEGINSVLSINRVDFEWLDWGLQCQTIFTNKYSNTNSISLDYIDFLFGTGIMLPLDSRTTITPGIHQGYLYRPKNNVWDGQRGAYMYGLTLKGRLWLGKVKKVALIASCAEDWRPDNINWEFNGRAGIEYRF